jgi:hypothetical protein
MNTALEYSTRVVQEGGRRCKKSTLNDLVHLTPLRIPLMNPPYMYIAYYCSVWHGMACVMSQRDQIDGFLVFLFCLRDFERGLMVCLVRWSGKSDDSSCWSAGLVGLVSIKGHIGHIGLMSTDKKEIKFSSYIRKFRGIGCKVLYD